VNIGDKFDETPLDKAVQKRKQACGEYLHRMGAKCVEKKYPEAWEQ